MPPWVPVKIITLYVLSMINVARYVTWQDPFLMTKEQRTKALRRHREAETNTTKWSSKVDPYQLA